MRENTLKAGDTIRCRDPEDVRINREALEKEGYKTKVIYTTIFIEGREEAKAK